MRKNNLPFSPRIHFRKMKNESPDLLCPSSRSEPQIPKKLVLHTRPRAESAIETSRQLKSSMLDIEPASDKFDQTEPSEILPFLFLGNSNHACSRCTLVTYEFTHVLCVEGIFRRELPGFKHLHVPMSDAGTTELTDVLPAALDHIDQARTSGGRVFVHCFAGVNRSPTVVLAYLVMRFGWRLREAWCHLTSRRPIVSPHVRYRVQLLDIEAHVRGVTSMNLDEWARWTVDNCSRLRQDLMRRRVSGATATACLHPPVSGGLQVLPPATGAHVSASGNLFPMVDVRASASFGTTATRFAHCASAQPMPKIALSETQGRRRLSMPPLSTAPLFPIVRPPAETP